MRLRCGAQRTVLGCSQLLKRKKALRNLNIDARYVLKVLSRYTQPKPIMPVNKSHTTLANLLGATSARTQGVGGITPFIQLTAS